MKTSIRTSLLKVLKIGKRFSISELANLIDASPKRVQHELKSLSKEGYNVEINPDSSAELSKLMPRASRLKINTRQYYGNDWIRFGVISDTHLVSKYSRLDVINALYDIYEHEGIHTVYHAGNWIDGEARFNKYDLYCIGVENQVKYFIENYPKREGITTYIISGDDHEGWYVQNLGLNIGRIMEDRARDVKRKDLIDLGYMERDLIFKKGKGQSIIRVMHAGGGSAYAISYTVQKIAESYQGGEKPSFVIVGHFHKFDYSYPREIHFLQPGCTQDQSPFMRKKRIQAMVGGCIVNIKQDNHGVFVRVQIEWFPFYDKKFYEYKW